MYTVTNLESVVLQLQEGWRLTRSESEATKQENNSLRQEVARLRSGWQQPSSSVPRASTSTRPDEDLGAAVPRLNNATQLLSTPAYVPQEYASSSSYSGGSYHGHSPTLITGEDGVPKYAPYYEDPLNYSAAKVFIYSLSLPRTCANNDS